MMDDKSSMCMQGDGCGHCGGMCGGWRHMSVHRCIFWTLIISAVFAVGYCLGEAKGRYFDGWNDRYGMMMYRHDMMMGPAMIQKRAMMRGGMEDEGWSGGMMNDAKGGAMMGTGTMMR